jgi:hypothetical protein
VVPGTSPTSWYTTPENVQHIAYVGADDVGPRIHELFFKIGVGPWVHNDNIPGAAADAPLVASDTSPTSWYTTPENVEHIAYVGADDVGPRIHELFFKIGVGPWVHDKNNIPGAAAGAPLVVPGTSPTSWYTTPENVQHIAYVGADNVGQRIHELFFFIGPNGNWFHHFPPPGAASGAPTVISSTSPTSWYTTPENVEHIAYVGNDQLIHELAYFVVPPPTGVTPEQLAIFNAHNMFRDEHCVPRLQWSAELATNAQTWASGCHKDANGAFCHQNVCGTPTSFGENLGFGFRESNGQPILPGLSPEDAVQNWYCEIQNYNFDNPVFVPGFSPQACIPPVNAHFTQVVWKETTEVGCAPATCSTEAGQGTLWVCEYSPAGNNPQTLAENVLQPTCQ